MSYIIRTKRNITTPTTSITLIGLSSNRVLGPMVPCSSGGALPDPIRKAVTLLRVLAFRDSFPLRFVCGPLPSSGDEVSFGKTGQPGSWLSLK